METNGRWARSRTMASAASWQSFRVAHPEANADFSRVLAGERSTLPRLPSSTVRGREVEALPCLERAQPVGARDVDGSDLQAVTLSVFDDGRRAIKTHRLVVEQGGGESSQVMAFEVGAGVGEQGEA